MFNSVNFKACMVENLTERGFGKKRIKELTDDFDARAKALEADGKDPAQAAQIAMAEQFNEMELQARETLKRNAKMLAVQATNIARVREGVNAKVAFVLDGKKGSKGVAVARAAISLLEHDPRFAGQNYKSNQESTRGALYALFGDTLERYGKGFMGRQKGKASLSNVVREIKGEATGDASAKEMADAWLKVSDVSVDMLNAAGGSMRKLDRYFPQAQNSVKMAKATFDKWAADHMDALDWNKTRWPDGSMIPADQRMDVLRKVYDTMTTNGANKIDPTAFRGRGSALGNMLDDHRFLHYKDADSWMRIHDAYSEGNPFEVMVNHIEHMAHKIAMVQTFGPNPEMTASSIQSIVRSEAAKLGPQEVTDAEAILNNKFRPMFEVLSRQNAMDPHSNVGALVSGASNILTAAQLGSAALLAIPGDFMQTVAVRALNNQGLFRGVDTYIKALATDQKSMREIATQSGFVMDEVVMSTYAQSRWTGLATVGPQASRRLADGVMRLSMMSGHTRAARWAVQSEFMGLMHRERGKAFGDLSWNAVMQRYGITAEDWDVMRSAVGAWEPKPGVKFMRPLDIMQTDVADKDALFRKFQGMIHDESRTMVPEASVEAAVTMRGTTRPDTLRGALLYSFSMYKNFPISFMMIYGRLGMMAKTTGGRVAFYAGLGAGMTMVGAMGTQLREVAQGRDPLPMDTLAFWGKAFLSGGALAIWGDFLFANVNSYGQSMGDTAAGPVAGLIGDIKGLALGDPYAFAEAVGGLSGNDFQSNTGAKAVEFARRYTPGSSIWWARAALQRQVFDRLQDLADPKADQKRQRRMQKQKREMGNDYWWPLGETSPERAPQTGD